MSTTKVRAALVTAFRGGSFFADSKVQWENMKFDPPAEAWAAFFFLPSQPEVATLGTAGEDELNGLIQIDLNYPLHSGEKDVAAKFESIRALFRPGYSFAHEGQTVTIRSCGRSNGRVVNNYWRVSVSVFYYAYIIR